MLRGFMLSESPSKAEVLISRFTGSSSWAVNPFSPPQVVFNCVFGGDRALIRFFFTEKVCDPNNSSKKNSLSNLKQQPKKRRCFSVKAGF